MHNILKIITILLISVTAYGYDAVGIMNALTATSSCGQSAMTEVKVCDVGAGFLCVDTPPPSVIDEFVLLRGTIDIKNNILSSIGLFVQNEYTKEYKQIELGKSSDYSLDNDGVFSVKAPLGQKMGAFTITVTAVRSNGLSAKASVRTSRVAKPQINPKDVTVVQDPSQKNIQVDIDLLHSCQACDFFGIATGGLEITLNDTVKSGDGGTKQFSQKTNISSGGRFSMCVPTSDGEHEIRVSACNAATGYDLQGCPFVEPAAFHISRTDPVVIWSEPATPIYHAKDSPVVELAFKLGGGGDAKLKFNRDEEETLSPDATGEYRMKLKPQPGINVGVVTAEGESYPFTFGWGEVNSPFTGGGVKEVDDLWIKNAGGFSIRKSFWVNDVKQLLNNFLMSDEAKDLLEKLPEAMNNKTAKSDIAGVMESIKNEIPYCSGKSSMGDHNYLLKLVDAPKIGLAEITSADIEQDIVDLVLNMEDVKVLAQILKDDDFDGEMDSKTAFIPLKIAFRKIFAPVEIKVIRSDDKKPLFALTSKHTDCEYKSNNACTGRPAPLVPKTFVGGATPGGSFVTCDYKEQTVDSATKAACEGINLINSQTGLFATSVLDTINEKLTCDVSAVLTYILREWLKEVPVKVPLIGREFNVPVGLDLLGNQFNVDAGGVYGVVPALVGSPDFYSQFSKEYKSPDVGYIARPGLNSKPQIGSDFGFAFGEKFLNALLFVLTEEDPEGLQKGLLDWDISETFFNKLGFDFVKECDAFVPNVTDDKPSALCNLRPRVGELLGSALTTSGYFPQKHPIMLRIRGNRRLPPHVSFFNSGGKQYIDLQLGDIDISFYALQVDTSKPADQYGNLALKLSANGEPITMAAPIIKSKMSALIAFELAPISTDSADPSKFSLTLRPEVALSRVVFTKVQGGNATIIKDESLLSAFQEKIKYGINIYSMPENAVKIALPKEIDLESMIGDQFNIFGLEKISFGKDGLSFAVEASQEYLDIFTKFILTQTLTKDDKRREYMIPN